MPLIFRRTQLAKQYDTQQNMLVHQKGTVRTSGDVHSHMVTT
jgi:hypothetical protein